MYRDLGFLFLFLLLLYFVLAFLVPIRRVWVSWLELKTFDSREPVSVLVLRWGSFLPLPSMRANSDSGFLQTLLHPPVPRPAGSALTWGDGGWSSF